MLTGWVQNLDDFRRRRVPKLRPVCGGKMGLILYCKQRYLGAISGMISELFRGII
jgi:hypothetical protein